MPALSRRGIVLPALVVLGLVIAYGSTRSLHEGISPVQEGVSAPEFALRDLEGREIRLSDLRGRLVFLNFWATWCPPCRMEMPSMQNLFLRMQGRPFEMLAVSVDQNPGMVQDLRMAMGYTFPILLDMGGEVASLYQTTGVPETFLIGPDGKIVLKVIGPVDWEHAESLSVISQYLPVTPN